MLVKEIKSLLNEVITEVLNEEEDEKKSDEKSIVKLEDTQQLNKTDLNKVAKDIADEFNKSYGGPPNPEAIHQLRYPAYLFFSEEPGLTITSLPAYYEDNEFTKKCRVLSGSFDVSSWVRQWNVAIKFFGDKTIDIKRGDVLLYYRVNTNKKIKLVKFDSNNTETRAMMERCLSFKHYKAKWFVPHKLAESYEAFTRHKLKSKMMKIIKDNLYE